MLAAELLGYPVLVKAAAGGGGRGIRVAESASALRGAFASAQAEAEHAFGDRTVFIERKLAAARHVEVQVVADGAGTVWAVGIRDCSIQRRNQKVIEESACTLLDETGDEGAVRRGGAAVPRGRLSRRRHGRVPRLTRRAASSSSWRSTRGFRSSIRSPS